LVVRSAEKELAAAKNDDRKVSPGHWLYMSLRRQGKDAEARKMLAQFSKNMDVIENQTYHRLMLLYKGELPVDSGSPALGEMSSPMHGRVRHRELASLQWSSGGQSGIRRILAADSGGSAYRCRS
jgi:hypothetical protein